MSKRTCIVRNCRPEDRKTNSVTYFRLPSDPTRCKQWILNSNRKDLLNCKPQELAQLLICSNHFTEENISKTKPKRIFAHSLPTIFPAINKRISSQEETTAQISQNAKKPAENSPSMPPFKRIKLGQPYTVKPSAPEQKSSPPKAPIILNSMPRMVIQSSPAKPTILKHIQGPANKAIEVVNIPDRKPVAKKPTAVISKPVNAMNSMKNVIQLVDMNGKSQPTLIQVSGNHNGQITPELISQIQKALSLQAPQQITPAKPPPPPVVKTPSPFTLIVTPQTQKNAKPIENIDLTEDDEPKNKEKATGTSQKCVVFKCRQFRPKGIFSAPYDDFMLGLWRTCLFNSLLDSGDPVCDEHFLDADMFRMGTNKEYFLKKHALPAPNQIDIRPTCIVPFCRNQTSISAKETMYPIPFWKPLFGNWPKAICLLKNTYKDTLIRNRVCSRHFSKLGPINQPDFNPDKFLPPDMFISFLQEWKTTPTSETKDENVCVYLKCKAESTDESMKFIKCPNNFQLWQVWLTICKRGDILLQPYHQIESFIRKSHGVCFVHHREILNKLKQFEYLLEDEHSKKNYVPAAAGRKEDATKIEKKPTDTTTSGPDKYVYVPSKEYCAYVNCSTHVRTQFVKKYKFPVNKELLDEWSNAAGIEPNGLVTYDYLFICGKHFNLDQYTERGTLKKNSVPVDHEEYNDPKANNTNAHWLKKQWQTKKKVVVPEAEESNKQNSMKIANSNRATVYQKRTCTNCDGTGIVFGSDLSVYCFLCGGSGEIGSGTKAPLITLTRPGGVAGGVQTNTDLPAVSMEELLVLNGQKCCVKHCSSETSTHYLYPFPSITENRMFWLWIKAVTDSPSIQPDPKDPQRFSLFKRKKLCEKHFEPKYFEVVNGKQTLKRNAVPTLDLISNDTDVEVVEDKEITWESCVVDEPETSNPFIKGRAILKENSIVFQTIGKSLNFGPGCTKKGLNRFPYKLYSLPRCDEFTSREYVPPGHRFQIHTAVVIDDDSDVEAETVDMIYEAMKKNDCRNYKSTGKIKSHFARIPA